VSFFLRRSVDIDTAFLFKCQSEDWRRLVLLFEKALKRSENERRFNHPHLHDYQSWKFCQNRSSTFWDNRPICQFLDFFCRSTKTSKSFSGVTSLNLSKFVHHVATFNALISCLSTFQYFNLFWNGKIACAKRWFCDFSWFLVTMATSFERSPNEC